MIQQAVELGKQIDPTHPATLYMKDILQKLMEAEPGGEGEVKKG